MEGETLEKKVNVGVFVPMMSITRLLKQKPNKKLKALAKANLTAKTNLYFFSIKGIDTKEKCVNGVYYDAEYHKWLRSRFPYPNVIYKREGISKKTDSKKYKLFMKQIKGNIFYINHQRGFNKWDVYRKLMTCSNLKEHLPKTRLITSEIALKRIFNLTDKVYVKAVRGRQGRQVIGITRLENGTFEYRYYRNRVMRKHTDNISNLYRKLKKKLRKKTLIAQEAIDLIKHEDSIIDLRAEVQRNGDGELEIVAVAVRKSSKNSPITTHAESYPFDEFFFEIMGYTDEEIKKLKERLDVFLERVYLCLENHFGPIGELGIDCALDKKGQLWFIECNSQSAKVSLLKAYDEDVVHRAFLNPLEYAKYIYKTSNSEV